MYLSLSRQQRPFFKSLLLLRNIEHWCRQTCSLYSNFGAVSRTQFRVARVEPKLAADAIGQNKEALKKRFTFRATSGYPECQSGVPFYSRETNPQPVSLR